MSTKEKICWFALTTLVAIGLICSAALTRIHYMSHVDPSYEPVCAVSERINCETVALSPYSILWGIPISVWGLLIYLAIMALILLKPLRKFLFGADPPIGSLFTASLGFVLFSGYLAYVSITRIASICLFCNALYVVNLGLLTLSLLCLSYRRTLPWKAIQKEVHLLFSHPKIASLLLFVVFTITALLISHFPPYWSEKRKAPLPKTNEVQHGVTPQGDHWIGAINPVITILEFTDYECPYCRKSHRAVRDLVQAHPTQVRLVHRHFPLDQACNRSVTRPFHLRACELSRFAHCAGEQSKFWEANDIIFFALDHVRAYEIPLEGIALELGLNAPALHSCMSSQETRQVLEKDISEGLGKKIRGTPTYFVGEEAFVGQIPFQAIEKHLKESN